MMNKKASTAALLAVLLVAAVGVFVMVQGTSTTGLVADNAAAVAKCLKNCNNYCMQASASQTQLGSCLQGCKKKCKPQ